jgi:hypothetical protein
MKAMDEVGGFASKANRPGCTCGISHGPKRFDCGHSHVDQIAPGLFRGGFRLFILLLQLLLMLMIQMIQMILLFISSFLHKLLVLITFV